MGDYFELQATAHWEPVCHNLGLELRGQYCPDHYNAGGCRRYHCTARLRGGCSSELYADVANFVLLESHRGGYSERKGWQEGQVSVASVMRTKDLRHWAR